MLKADGLCGWKSEQIGWHMTCDEDLGGEESVRQIEREWNIMTE